MWTTEGVGNDNAEEQSTSSRCSSGGSSLPANHSILQASPISSAWLALLTYWTALRVTFAHLVTYETLFVSLVSAGCVVFYSKYQRGGGEEPLVARLALGVLFTIIVFPITTSIGYAFQRRETALKSIAGIKTYTMHIYVAHRDWAWENKKCEYSGRNKMNVTVSDEEKKAEEEWQADGGAIGRQHTLEVRFIMIKLIRAMRDYLSLPLVNRSRHLYTASGRRTRAIVHPVQQACLQDVYEQMQRLTLAVERTKEAGSPGNEAARINQYHSLLMKEWETAKYIKVYRTPSGLRAFARLYILVHPFFTGPYYAWVAGAGQSDALGAGDAYWPSQTNLAFAICLAIFTAVALQGLFNVEVGLEDPFDESEGLDNVKMHTSFREMEKLVSMEWAPGVWNGAIMHGASLVDTEFKQVPGEIPKDVPRKGIREAQEAIKKDSNPFQLWCC
jgi:hypothetical protein